MTQCQKPPGPAALGPEEIRFKVGIELSIFENVAFLCFLWLKVSSSVAGAALCGGAGRRAVRRGRGCPAPGAGASGRFQPVPQGTARPLHDTSSTSGVETALRKETKRRLAARSEENKCEKQPPSPSCRRGGGFGGERVTQPGKEGVRGKAFVSHSSKPFLTGNKLN